MYTALVSHEREQLKVMLMEYHTIFSLEENERGKTDLVQFEIDTGDSPPKKQVDILISKNQALQILYLKHCIYKTT